MKTTNKAIIATAMALCSMTAAADIHVHWENLGNYKNQDDKFMYRHRFTITGDTPQDLAKLHRLAYNQFNRATHALAPGDTVRIIVPGYFVIDSERFGKPADSIVIDLETRNTCIKTSFVPDGVHGVDADGKPFDVKYTRGSITQRPEQWNSFNEDFMPYGDKLYALNESLAYGDALGYFDMIPSFKSARLTGDQTPYTGAIEGTTTYIAHENPEFYRITVTPQALAVEAASPQAAKMAWRSLRRLAQMHDGQLMPCVIEDYPDYGYRGLMIDVSRNFQPISEMYKLLDVMADYRMNRLQFHLTDDEAWRFEVPALPELTEVAARRGYTLDEKEFLAQLFTGNGDPNNPAGSANGYYTRQEMIDFLKYADSLGIVVIPEVETPGHARAAIKAMQARATRTGDDKWLLSERADDSQFVSAQAFRDNVMNPALEGPYLLMDIVFDELISIYREAGAPLEIIHIGGDEVPTGAWSRSKAVAKLMQEKGLPDEGAVHSYWMQGIVDMAKQKGVKIAGWQEVVLGKSDEVAKEMAPQFGFINIWTRNRKGSTGELTSKTRELGIPALMCIFDHCYLDFCYDYHPDEPGLYWGGTMDEFITLDGYTRQIAPDADTDQAPMLGVQGQLWAEALRSPQDMERALFPKSLGLIERAWNADSTFTKPQYNAVIAQRELPYLDTKDMHWRLRQPGISVADGVATLNTPYPGAVIRYTTDGSEPTAQSAVYTAPFAVPQGCQQIRASLFYRGKQSVPAILFL